jgi:hypothetical protein
MCFSWWSLRLDAAWFFKRSFFALLDWILALHIVPRIRYLGFSHLREEGSLDYDGGFVRLQIQTNFDTTINRQHSTHVELVALIAGHGILGGPAMEAPQIWSRQLWMRGSQNWRNPLLLRMSPFRLPIGHAIQAGGRRWACSIQASGRGRSADDDWRASSFWHLIPKGEWTHYCFVWEMWCIILYLS